MKLSHRAKVLLCLVDSRSEVDWTTGEVKVFFVPFADPMHVENLIASPIWVHGPADANALKGLERKGLIRRPKTSLPNDYLFVITEEGRMVCEEIHAEMYQD